MYAEARGACTHGVEGSGAVEGAGACVGSGSECWVAVAKGAPIAGAVTRLGNVRLR